MVAMNQVKPRVFRGLILCGWMLIGVAAPVAADFLASYKEGIRAIEQQQWERAAHLMRVAIASRPKEKGRLPRRMYFHDYIPHYYLGLALFEQGDCDGALQSWTESQRQGLIARRKEHEIILAKRPICDKRSVKVNPQESQKLGAVNEPATDALHQLETSQSDAEQLRKVIEARKEAEEQAKTRQQLNRLSQAAREVLASMDRYGAYPPQLDRQRASLEQLAWTSEAVGPETPAAEVEDLRARLSRSVSVLRKAFQPPPAELLAAAEAYFAGSYEEVDEILTDLDPRDQKAIAHVSLLLAAARFALYRVGGEVDGALLENARRGILDARQAEPALAPPRRAFSPGFVDFFNRSVSTSP